MTDYFAGIKKGAKVWKQQETLLVDKNDPIKQWDVTQTQL